MSMFDLFKKKKKENRFHRFLDIPVDPKIDLFARTDYDPMYYRHMKVEDTEINLELAKWIEGLGFNPIWVEAFYTPPYGGKIPIHTDTPELSDVVKINWTYGAPKSKLIWWEPKHEKYIDTFQTEFGSPYLTAKERHCKKLLEVEINKPSLVNIGTFHSTWNPTEEGRWTLSLPLVHISSERRVLWDEALDKLSEYVSKDQV